MAIVGFRAFQPNRPSRRDVLEPRNPVAFILLARMGVVSGERGRVKMKGLLRLRPCYHRTTERIEAHVMLTILAANCVRYLERSTDRKYPELLALFKPLKAIQLDDGRSRYWQRSELTSGQIEVLDALQLPTPPTTWDVWIELEKMRPKPRGKGPSSRKGQ